MRFDKHASESASDFATFEPILLLLFNPRICCHQENKNKTLTVDSGINS